jgi:formylglycine-generating enzyme required for sulfatase activity
MLVALAALLHPACHRDNPPGDNNNNGDPGPCGEGWVHIPAGPFEMGVDEYDSRFYLHAPQGTYPKVIVQMSDYCIQHTEVSVASYRECVDASACEEPAQVTEGLGECNYALVPSDREDHPVTCMTWEQARTYCRDWEGGDLPSEAQWEKAARGDSMDGRILPWGDAPVSCTRANYDENGPYNDDTGEGSGYGCFHQYYPSTWPVGYLRTTKGDSPYGVKDMAGNVAEVTLDCFDKTFYARCVEQGCVDPVDVEFEGCWHSARGGTTATEGSHLQTISRGGPGSDEFGTSIGFRCAKAYDP